MNLVLVPALNAEWATLADSSRGEAALARWAATEPALHGYLTLGELRHACVVKDHHTNDAVLYALTQIVRRDRDPLATRVIVQQLLPGVLGMIRRLGGTRDVEADVIGTLITRIACYPATRPTAVATNLYLDTLHDLTAHTRRAESPRVVGSQDVGDGHLGAGPRACVVGPDADPAVEARLDLWQLIARARRSGALTADDLAVLVDAWLCDQPAHVSAAAVGVTPAAMRQRRSRVIARLRGVAVAA